MDKYIFKYLFPEKCISCGIWGSLLCANCWDLCTKINSHYSLNFEDVSLDVISLLSYEGVARECLRHSKFFSKQFRILKVLTEKCLEDLSYSFDNYIVVPIPSSKERLRKRGFNQAQIISKIMAEKFHLREHSILTRKTLTVAQFELTKGDRFENLKHAFEVPKSKVNYVKDKKILLVDDLCTSGATFIFAAKTLYENGAKEVLGFSLMRQFRRSKVKLKDVGIVQNEHL